MDLTLVVSQNCNSCRRVESQLREIARQHNKIKIIIVDLKNFSGISFVNNRHIIIVPALFIEDELFSYGDIEEKRLLKQIKEKLF